MSIKSGRARWQFIVLIIILAALVAGCANVRRGVSWPALSLVTIGDETTLIVAYEKQVLALDPSDGNVLTLRDSNGEIRLDDQNNPLRWSIDGGQFDGEQFFANPFPSSSDGNDTLIFPTYSNRFLEFNVDDLRVVNAAGIPLTDGVIAAPIVTDKFIYVAYSEQDVVALDRETYEEVWRLDTLEGVWAPPLLHEGVLYVPSIDHMLYAVDAETGEAVWAEPLNLQGAIAATPLYYDGFLYVGSYSHKMYKISLAGQIVAEHEGSNWIWGTPAVFEDESGAILYYTDLSGYVYALKASDLSEVWVRHPANRGIRPAPIVTDNFVVVASRNGTIYWLGRDDGVVVFEREMRGTPEILSDLLVVTVDRNGDNPLTLMLVASTDMNNLVAAYHLDNSVEEWVYPR